MAAMDTENFTSNAPIYSHVFTFEENFSPERGRQWLGENYTNGFLFCGIYVFLIFSIQFRMSNKTRYELRLALVLWNAALSIFSAFGALRSVPELYYMLTNHSFYQSVCYPTILEPIKAIEFWSWAFALSKLLELGDTMFVVLRKQPLNFIHWFHHVVTLIYIWAAYVENSAYLRWFRAMNYTIHSYMYFYYMLRVLRVSVSKYVMMSITVSQIVQMIIGCIIPVMGLHYRLNEQPCQISYVNIFLAECMFFSYLILFSRMFCKLYLTPSKKISTSVTDNIKVK